MTEVRLVSVAMCMHATRGLMRASLDRLRWRGEPLQCSCVFDTPPGCGDPYRLNVSASEEKTDLRCRERPAFLSAPLKGARNKRRHGMPSRTSPGTYTGVVLLLSSIVRL